VTFEPGSLAQATYGLVVCFFCAILYSLCSPYVDPGEDRLAQLCQVLIFVVLLSSIVLRADRSDETSNGLDILLTVMTALPMVAAIFMETPLPDLMFMGHGYLVRQWTRRGAADADKGSAGEVAVAMAGSTSEHSGLRDPSVEVVEAGIEQTPIEPPAAHAFERLQQSENAE